MTERTLKLDAMILAAGFGTRMRPLTESVPKALLPLHNVPLLEWSVSYLESLGVQRIIVNAHHHASQVEAWAAKRAAARGPDGGTPEIVSGKARGVSHTIVLREDEILGTGGGIANALPHVETDPVLFFNVDLLFRPDLGQALRLHRELADERPEMLGTLLLIRNPQFAKVRVEGPWITKIRRHADPGDSSLWAFSGVYFLSRRALAGIPSGGFVDLAPLLRDWAERGLLGACLCPEIPFLEVGGLASYWETHRSLARLAQGSGGKLSESDHTLLRGTTLWRSAESQVDESAHWSESVLMKGARVRAGVKVERSIVAWGADVTTSMAQQVWMPGDGGTARNNVADGTTPAHRLLPLPVLSSDDEARVRRFLENEDASLQLLHGTPQGRRVLRVSDPRGTRIVLVDPTEAARSSAGRVVYPRRHPEGTGPSELDTWIYVARHLEALGVRVPRVETADRAAHMVLVEDAGDESLEMLVQRYGAPSSEVDGAYLAAVDQLGALQQAPQRPFDPDRTCNPDYDADFTNEFEIGYFVREVLQDLLGLWDDLGALRERFLEETQTLARTVAALPRALIHRDFQSRNLLYRDGTVVVIDFQGARIGPYVYDLASLLADPYVSLSAQLHARLIERFRQVSPHTSSKRSIGDDLTVCGLVRMFQIGGALAFLGGRQGRPGFLEHLADVLKRCSESARAANLAATADVLDLSQRHWNLRTQKERG